MVRPLRFEYKGALYHVHARGNERRKIFFTDTDYKKFKDYITGAIEKYHCLVHCYVLMGNHYHLSSDIEKCTKKRHEKCTTRAIKNSLFS
ncbi:MAG: transposase [Deltaproteobacteria bacterium]|nr:transposase [Deltaproteobacteria bacterium]